MSETVNTGDAAPELVHQYPPGFRPRRAANWISIGLLYTSYYMCRYNLGFANEPIRKEFGMSKGDIGWVISIAAYAYGVGQIINGLIADRIGGKKAMLIGAVGTVIMNVVFGLLSVWTVYDQATGRWVVPILHTGVAFSLLTTFAMVRGIDRYLQAFGAPGMVKINAAWFRKTERGSFAGIFGFMINLGRTMNNVIAPLILSGFSLFWIIPIHAQHWRWLFYFPAVVCSIMAICLALIVKETPEECGFDGQIPLDGAVGDADVRAPLLTVLTTVLSKPAVWIAGLAYACTGVVRLGVDEWFPSYMSEVHHVDFKSASFITLTFLLPLMASLGSFVSGVISDKVFTGNRAPVAAVLYAMETVIILTAAQFHSSNAAVFFFILIALTANSTHSILGTAAAMDIGGRKMTGFASGLIDSFQYFGGALAGATLGAQLDHSWDHYYYFLAPFGAIGCVIMILGNRWMKGGGKSAH